MTVMDTIFALASGRGRAGVAVFRLSGPQAGAALESLTGQSLPPARAARLRWLKDPETADRLDQALVLWFPGPGSFTGEDVVELQIHGGAAVSAAVARALGKLPGLRPAEAGEYARRAFANDRLDLTSAEGLGDLINAETEGQRRQALRQMDGAMERIYEGWRTQLIEALAMTEAAIDFADEDLPDDVGLRARPVVAELCAAMERELTRAPVGERLRDGLTVAILGAPNAGKSSLLNALARREAAIVSDRAGTTRDVIEVHLDLHGLPMTLLDTAGLHDTVDDIELEGIRRARARALTADFRILLLDARDWPVMPEALRDLTGPDSLLVINKTDLRAVEETAGLAVSAKTGAGIDHLIETLTARAEALMSSSEPVLITRQRHRYALEDCVRELQRFLAAGTDRDFELLAEDLRMAARALGRITGRVDVEDLLDVIFSEFCIGK
ncbi:tRNA uridine-5-carboxymethylaminomethyl(34) synthesis GTPase MnmE [Govanella unica]|uniref:tRNA modification GTPase MnmE n=1 Tax=Govanella unica TaxID=2975056 RepID=A0A9X3TUT9_9PROT|nr:tRNA uridine-5-carboxymethylaminomethyl(34) synthesis GTPase MnmE [Govania unica]MDA5192388.1 tRNA uridine-5-carboxymethylaminomethyl(34) synthesis GTPase MnmE [Govania unica]